MIRAIKVRFDGRGKVYHFKVNDIELCCGDAVIVETSIGIQYAETVSEIFLIDTAENKNELRPILRKADQADILHQEENERLEEEAFAICLEKIAKHKLKMDLVDVKYMFDNKKITFFFTADGRVDFRALVRDLASTFRSVRIELRQIGEREETRLLGGLGICGQELCCKKFSYRFDPVSIKMAKDQNLSMNPSKISGTCGRLRCCLKYEHQAYQDALRRLPRQGKIVQTKEGPARIVAVDLLREKLSLRLEQDGEQSQIEVYFKDLDKI